MDKLFWAKAGQVIVGAGLIFVTGLVIFVTGLVIFATGLVIFATGLVIFVTGLVIFVTGLVFVAGLSRLLKSVSPLFFDLLKNKYIFQILIYVHIRRRFELKQEELNTENIKTLWKIFFLFL